MKINNSVEDSHENVHNTQEHPVNNDDINIDIVEKTIQKTPWYKQRKFIIGSIIGAAVIILTVIVLVCVLKNKGSNPEPDILKYKISSKYFESINNIITTFNLEQNLNLSNTRRLDDNSYEYKKTKIIKTKYLLNVIPKNDDLFTAYIAILSRDEVSEGLITNTFNDSDIIYSDNNNYKAVAKFDFYKNGTKKNTNFLKNTEIIYQNEIEAIIPCLIPSLNSNKSKLNDNSYKLQNSVNELIIIGNDTLPDLSNSEIEVVTLNQEVSNVKMSSTSKMANGKFEIDENIDLDETSAINGLIKSIETTSNQNINFLRDDGESLAKKYEEKFKNLEFEESSSNRLRLLSNEKYIENIRLKNGNGKEYKNIKNIRELVDVDFTSSLEYPLSFRYEFFKIESLGLKLNLLAHIEWIPKSGAVKFMLSYKRGSKTIELEPKYLTISNYSEVVLSYKTIKEIIIKYLNKDIIEKIDNNYDETNKLLNEYLIKYANNLDELLDPLSKLFNDSLKTQLDNFKEKVFKYSRYCYNGVFEYIENQFEPYLTSIENEINTNQQNEINKLVEESNSTIIYLIDSQKENITNLIESVKIFIHNSIETINKLTIYEKVPIDFYYRVKEIFKRIDVIIDSFDDIFISSIDKEFLQLQTFVNDNIYMGEIDSLLDQIEVIWDIFYNNQILNETVTYNHATGIVIKIEKIRDRYLNIKDSLLSSVKNVYETIKKNKLSIASSNIQSLKKDLNIEEQSFIDSISKKVNFISNYTLYNEDIKKITSIENDISNLKINAFENNITNKLDEINTESFISSSEINNIKEEIKKEVELLLNNLKYSNVENYKKNFANILSTFNNLVSDNKINNIVISINQNFNLTFLNSLLNDYYKNIMDNGISLYSKLEYEIINKNLDKYITEPVELINKIKGISNNKEVNAENLNNKLNKILKEKLLNLFNSVILTINKLISSEINNILDKIDYNIKDKYNEEVNEFFKQSNKIIETLEKQTLKYSSSINSEFILLSTINKNEEKIEKKINETINALLLQFHYLFCKDNSSNCPNAGINQMDEYDKYYFQVSKLRDALNHLTLLQPYINDVVNDNNLNELSSNDFLNLYKNQNNFDKNIINGEIKRFLYNLNYEGKLNTKENVILLKEIIKNSFTSGYNLTQQIYTTFLNTLMETPKDLEEKLEEIFINIKRLAKEGTEKDSNYHKNNKFYFNSVNTKLDDEFENLIKKYNIQLQNKQSEVLNSLTIDYEFNKTLIEKFEDKIYNDINAYQGKLLLNLSSLGEKTCILLDYNITLENIVYDAIIELKNEISYNIKTNLTSQYEIPLDKFKNAIKVYFNKFNNDFIANYKYFFNNYRNLLLNKTEKIKNSSSYEVTSLTTLIKEGFEKGFNYSLIGMENLINQNNFSKMINNKDKINEILKNLFNNIALTIPNNELNLNNNINNLKVTCDQELKREKDIFKDNVLEYIIKGFNNTVKAFINGTGKSYLENIYLNDYENKIVSKLDYILSQSIEIDEYLYLVIDGLFDVDSYLTDSVKEVYYQLMNYINDGITQDKVSSKILKKLLDFKYDSAKKIIDYFKDYTLGILTSNSFKNSLSLQVQELIPTNIPLTITLNFTNFYYEILDSAYLKNIHNIYSTKIDEKRQNIIKEVDRLRFERTFQIGGIGQGISSSDLASAITEYNTLNATLSKINNDFSFDLSDSKINNTKNLLASIDLKNKLKKIPILYKQDYEKIQRNITNNVSINVDLTDFISNINELKKKNSLFNNSEFEEIREKFKNTILDLFKNLEKNVKTNYNTQASNKTDIKPINFNLRRLDSDIQIESIQSIIDEINIKFTNLTKVITNPENLISISSKINQINNAITVQLISLKNTLDTYLGYVEFYLHKTDTLNQYQNNMTIIYSNVEELLNNYILNQSEIITKIYNSLSKYDSIYNEEIKLDLLDKINNIIKEGSQKLMHQYLTNSNKSDLEMFYNLKNKNLSSLNDLNSALGSIRFNYSTFIDNTKLEYGYNFIVDEDNYKVYLNLSATASAEAYITYQSESISSNIAGLLGEGMIGLNLEMDFLNEDVKAIYKTEFKNTNVTKELYENKTKPIWDNCTDVVECYEKCPKSYTTDNGKEIQITSNEEDLEYYKNSSIYEFKGLTENKLCSYSRYLKKVLEEMYSFNSSLVRTV